MELVIRTTVIYWFLFLVMRGVGKRSLSELSPLDLMLVVVMGDIVQQGVTQEDMSITGAMVAVAVFVLWTMTGDWLTRRSKSARSVLTGEPVIILRDGSLLMDSLERERLTVEDVTAAAREQGFGDFSAIAIGVLEDDGKFSFLPHRS